MIPSSDCLQWSSDQPGPARKRRAQAPATPVGGTRSWRGNEGVDRSAPKLLERSDRGEVDERDHIVRLVHEIAAARAQQNRRRGKFGRSVQKKGSSGRRSFSTSTLPEIAICTL